MVGGRHRHRCCRRRRVVIAIIVAVWEIVLGAEKVKAVGVDACHGPSIIDQFNSIHRDAMNVVRPSMEAMCLLARPAIDRAIVDS
jgi:hypothetical protein